MPPKFKDLKNFCEKNDWELLRDTDHFYYLCRECGEKLRESEFGMEYEIS